MPRFGGMRGQAPEKSKDFVGAMKKLLGSLKNWRLFILIAIILAGSSALFSLVAPRKLTELTNYVTEGISPNVDKLGEIATKSLINVTMGNISGLSEYDDVTKEDVELTRNLLKKITITSTAEDISVIIKQIPENVINHLLKDIEVDGVLISVKDQKELYKLNNSLESFDNSMELLQQVDKLPKSIYGLIKPSINLHGVKRVALFMAILYVVSAIFNFVQSLIMCSVSNNYAKYLRSRISNKINLLPLKYFDSHETGDVLSRITNDVDSIAQNLHNSLGTLVTSITLFVGSTIMMFVTNYIMAITAIVASFIGFSLMFLILRKSQKYFNARQESLGELNGYIEEMYTGHNVVSAYNGIEKSVEVFNKTNDKLFVTNRVSQFLSGLMGPIMGFVGNLSYVAVCVMGSVLVMQGKISFGVIVAFMIYIRQFTNPLSQIAQTMTSLQSTAAASERVFEFLDEKELKDESKLTDVLERKDAKGCIEFKNVKFGYDKNKTIIKDFNVRVDPGQKVAIVGPTGAGKTTLVNLLMKFYEINDGDIIIDGKSIKNLKRENVHDLFCMVLQDTWLFEGTIGDNIRFNTEDISDEDIMQACRTVGVSHFVKTLPGGLNAMISDSDAISQGQKQLFTIARGMIEDCPFLILDEATSNVDTRTEELVQKAMDRLMVGRTSFIIAHRLSTIKNADLILVMNEGNIVEMGSHDDLIEANGFYSELYNSQFESIID
jgi:ATP-binding cassette subfamily B protein